MDLYAEIILDHSKNPQNAGLREPYEAEAVSYTHLRAHET